VKQEISLAPDGPEARRGQSGTFQKQPEADQEETGAWQRTDNRRNAINQRQRAKDLVEDVEHKAEADTGDDTNPIGTLRSGPKINDSAISIITATDIGWKILLHILS
jgi:hypothetical protein